MEVVDCPTQLIFISIFICSMIKPRKTQLGNPLGGWRAVVEIVATQLQM